MPGQLRRFGLLPPLFQGAGPSFTVPHRCLIRWRNPCPAVFMSRRLPMPTGTVKWFNAQKGYGFIQPEDGTKDVFVHISAVERAGLGSLHEGQRISYQLERGQQGKTSAVDLQVA